MCDVCDIYIMVVCLCVGVSVYGCECVDVIVFVCGGLLVVCMLYYVCIGVKAYVYPMSAYAYVRGVMCICMCTCVVHVICVYVYVQCRR